MIGIVIDALQQDAQNLPAAVLVDARDVVDRDSVVDVERGAKKPLILDCECILIAFSGCLPFAT